MWGIHIADSVRHLRHPRGIRSSCLANAHHSQPQRLLETIFFGVDPCPNQECHSPLLAATFKSRNQSLAGTSVGKNGASVTGITQTELTKSLVPHPVLQSRHGLGLVGTVFDGTLFEVAEPLPDTRLFLLQVRGVLLSVVLQGVLIAKYLLHGLLQIRDAL